MSYVDSDVDRQGGQKLPATGTERHKK
jgi:hypothetical protein